MVPCGAGNRCIDFDVTGASAGHGSGKKFQYGVGWQRVILDPERIQVAQADLLVDAVVGGISAEPQEQGVGGSGAKAGVMFRVTVWLLPGVKRNTLLAESSGSTIT
ncbi:MAG: hypothetical protein LR015_14605 [Verrucomicrobia bacterium]|nr:hypothetical protein [Verrucomicrobiota bacterium]